MEDTTINSNDQNKPPSRLASSRTFPVNLHSRHRSDAARPTNPSTARSGGATEERQPWPRRLFVDTSVDVEHRPPSSSEKSKDKSEKSDKSDKSHRYSKSRDYYHNRLPKAMNQIASAGGARNLLPNRTFYHRQGSVGGGEDTKFKDNKEKDREIGDYGFLRPIASTISHSHDSSRSRFGSRSSSAHNHSRSRTGSLAVTEEDSDLNGKLGLTKKKEIKTMEDLIVAKQEREKGEAFLRSTLSSIGSLATDITRQLDYTYYNLLERMSALNSTIRTFQDLVDSSATLHENFQRDNTNLEHDVHRQLADFQTFEPQRRRIDELEKRMKAGRSRMETLGVRLETVRKEIEGWEQREGEWQARVSRRLRLLWGVMGSVILVGLIAYGVQNWRNGSSSLSSSSSSSTTNNLNWHIEMLTQQSRDAAVEDETQTTTQLGRDDVDIDIETFLKSPLLSKEKTAAAMTSDADADATTDASEDIQSSTGSTQDKPDDPLRLFDEL